MNFNVVIGNPPYQLSDGGNGSSAKPLYHLFIQEAKKLNPKYLTMIIPARWYSGGKGLDFFRKEMINDKRIKELHDFPETKYCFPNLNIRGGVCYFLWSKNNKRKCKVVSYKKNNIFSIKNRYMNEEDVNIFIRYNEAVNILNKIKKFNELTMDNRVQSRNHFGISTNFSNFTIEQTNKNNILLHKSNRNNSSKEVYVNINNVIKNKKDVNRIKVLVSKASPGNDIYPHSVISMPKVSIQHSVSTESYIIVDFVESLEEANNLISYMKTDFFRFLMILMKNSQNISKNVFSFIPIQSWNESWTNEKLYKKYNITNEEVDFIKTLIKPMKD